MNLTPQFRRQIAQALREDLGRGDITTRLLVSKSLTGSGVILAKQNGILAGSFVATEVFRQLDSRIHCEWIKKDGDKIFKGQTMARIRGPVSSILSAERVALNFVSHLSGVATLTNQFVRKVRGTRAKILSTRKTIPLWRLLQKYAVRMGGGANHRIGLWDQGLVKDNHWELVSNARKITETIRRYPKYRWAVELTNSNFDQLESILASKPSVILLDNFKPAKLARVIRTIRFHSKKINVHPLIEVSGGIQLDNVRAFAKAGPDRISIGALTHSVPAFDFSLEMKRISK